MDFSDSERGESEYESDGEEDERSPPRKRVEEPEQDYEEDEEEDEDHDEAERNELSEDEAEVSPFAFLKISSFGYPYYMFWLSLPAVVVQWEI